MRILLVDEDDGRRAWWRRHLELLGYECAVAATGPEGWARFLERPPDVVICEWLLTGLNGIELCRRIREAGQNGYGYAYVVLVSPSTQPHHRLQTMLSGADDYLTRPLDAGELRLRLLVAERVSTLHRKLMEQAEELEHLNRLLYEDGRRDALTGIPNRLKLEEDLPVVHSLADRYGFTYSVALFDIDRFKDYNDRYGHQEGDAVLRTVARVLSKACRMGDTVYRYGGEEFLAVFPGQTPEGAGVVVERMREAIERCEIARPDSGVGGARVLTVSAGFASRTEETAVGMDELIRLADEAMYEAKRAGRNRSFGHGKGSISPQEAIEGLERELEQVIPTTG